MMAKNNLSSIELLSVIFFSLILQTGQSSSAFLLSFTEYLAVLLSQMLSLRLSNFFNKLPILFCLQSSSVVNKNPSQESPRIVKLFF